MTLAKVKIRRSTTDTVMASARTTAFITRELADIAQFPPARAAATILVLIFDVVEGMQRNKQACRRLARRAADILLDVRTRMNGRWESAPPSFVRNLRKLESTLDVIHDFMRREAEAGWRERLVRKATIEEALGDYNTLLDDAARSFQIGSLIDIHYTLHQVSPKVEAMRADQGPPAHSSAEASTVQIEVLNAPAPIVEEALCNEPEQANEVEPMHDDVPGSRPDGEISIFEGFDDRGFPRYQRSDIVAGSRQMRSDQGWWGGAAEVRVNGEVALMKTYEGPNAAQDWLADVKTLQSVYHPNMPQLMGLSDDTTPVPFVLLTNVRTRTPEAKLLDALRRGSLAFCAELVLRLYRDVSEAALYTQQEMSYSNSDLQDFVEKASYRIDEDANVVVGLPPPPEGKWITARSYSLTESLLGIALKMLPNRGRPVHLLKQDGDEMSLDMQRKLSHLAVFARALLPHEDQPPQLAPSIDAFITHDYDGRPTLSLSSLRSAVLSAASDSTDRDAYCWRENQGIPAHKFKPGDLGHLPPGGALGQDFVKLCNVLDEGIIPPAEMQLTNDAWGTQWDWDDPAGIRRQELPKYNALGGATCWPVGVLPGQQMDCQVEHTTRAARVADGWKVLLKHGKQWGERFGVSPHELVLITSAAACQNFAITNGFKSYTRSRAPFGGPQHAAFPGGPPMHGGHFGMPGHQTNHGWGSPTTVPKIFYLFTSLDPAFQPYWSQAPMPVMPGQGPPALDYGCLSKVGWCTGCVWYIMAHKEDFE